MLYRVRIDLCFDEGTAQALFDKAKLVLSKAIKLATPVGNPEVSFIEIHKCYHDEDEPKPCEIIKRIEVQ